MTNIQQPPATDKPKAKYRVTNWPVYDRALVERGHLNLWFDGEVLRDQWRPPPTGRRGHRSAIRG
jgi:hypothetical protein